MDYNSDEALKLSNQLCFPLYAAARKVTGFYSPYLRPLGLTYTQYIVFMVLWEKDGVTVGEICEKLRLDSGTLTPLLKKMEKEGYMTRERCREDERRVIIRLTEKGAAMKEKVRDIPLKVGSCVRLSGEEAGSLYSLLYRILDMTQDS